MEIPTVESLLASFTATENPRIHRGWYKCGCGQLVEWASELHSTLPMERLASEQLAFAHTLREFIEKHVNAGHPREGVSA